MFDIGSNLAATLTRLIVAAMFCFVVWCMFKGSWR